MDGSAEIKLGDITPTRDLLYVADTVDGFIKIANAESLIGHEVNIATQSEISVEALAGELIKQINPLARVITDNQRLRPPKSEVFRLFGSNEKLTKFTNWTKNHSLPDGLKRTIDWFRDTENRKSYKADTYNL